MFDDDSIRFKVVANHQEQYSIWPDFKEIPAGWIAVGPTGTKDECLDYIERVWTDMRPKTLRDKMGGAGTKPTAEITDAASALIAKFSEEVNQYSGGRPELYGWFVARLLEERPDSDPDAARAALDGCLPAHTVPANYA